jgi:hypothetical protein
MTEPHMTREQLILRGDDYADVDESRVARQVGAQMYNDDLIEDILDKLRAYLRNKGALHTSKARFRSKLEDSLDRYDNWLSSQETRA